MIIKCDKCKRFFYAKSIEEASTVFIKDEVNGHGISVYLCVRCIDMVRNKLYSMLDLDNSSEVAYESKI